MAKMMKNVVPNVVNRDKPNVNVGTIGHIDPGKTTLTSAILRVQSEKGLAQFKSYEEIAKGGIVRDKSKTVTILAAHVRYETDHQMKLRHAPVCLLDFSIPTELIHPNAKRK